MMIFTRTTTTLAAGFVENFGAETLPLALNKINQETDVEIITQENYITLVGHWDEIVKAHTYFEIILNDEINSKEKRSLDVCDTLDVIKEEQHSDKAKEKIPDGIVNDDRKHGQKPDNTAKRSYKHSCIHDPIVLHLKRSLKYTDMSADVPSDTGELTDDDTDIDERYLPENIPQFKNIGTDLDDFKIDIKVENTENDFVAKEDDISIIKLKPVDCTEDVANKIKQGKSNVRERQSLKFTCLKNKKVQDIKRNVERQCLDACDKLDDITEEQNTDKGKEKTPYNIVNDGRKHGRKPDNTVRIPSKRSCIPDPIVIQYHQKRSLKYTDMSADVPSDTNELTDEDTDIDEHYLPENFPHFTNTGTDSPSVLDNLKIDIKVENTEKNFVAKEDISSIKLKPVDCTEDDANKIGLGKTNGRERQSLKLTCQDIKRNVERQSLVTCDKLDGITEEQNTDKAKEKISSNIVDDIKHGRKPDNIVRQSSKRSCMPDPLVIHSNKKRSFKKQQLTKTTNLLNIFDTETSKSLNQGNKNISIIRQRLVDKLKKEERVKNDVSDINKESHFNEALSEMQKILDDMNCENSASDMPFDTGKLIDGDTNNDKLLLENNPQSTNTGTYNPTVLEHSKVAVKIENIENDLIAKEEDISSIKLKPVDFTDNVANKIELEKNTRNRRKGKSLNLTCFKNKKLQEEKLKNKKTENKPGTGRIEDIEYQCELCNYTGKKKVNLREHIKRKHRNKFTCEVCQKQFGLKKDYTRHKIHVHAEPSYFCDICKKPYKTKIYYDEHILSHKDNYIKPIYDCKICKKTFSAKYVLGVHIKADHLGIKKSYMCPTCGQTFTQRNTYVMHANAHAGIKPYVCDVCGSAFSYDKSLSQHKLMHDTSKQFQCHICSKEFRQSASLYVHMKVHKDTKDYMCKSCGKGFTQKQSLLRHERIHSGDKPFSCNLCSQTFNDTSIIRRHIILVHKKDPKTWRSEMT